MRNTIEEWADVAEAQIQKHTEAGQRYATLAAREIVLEAERPRQKREAIIRIMAGPNELTGKAHSASSAEAIVETDETYLAHLVKQSRVVLDKNMALTDTQSARLRAELAIALLKSESSVTSS